MKLALLTLAAAINPVLAGDPFQTNDTKSFAGISDSSLVSSNKSGGKNFDLLSTNWPGVLFPPGKSLFDLKDSSELPPAAPDFRIQPDGSRAGQRDFFFGHREATNSFPGAPGLRAAPGTRWRGEAPATPAPAPLEPGVYLTLPYTMMVIVPGPHPDRIARGAVGTNETGTMLRFEPGLKLYPYPPAERK